MDAGRITVRVFVAVIFFALVVFQQESRGFDEPPVISVDENAFWFGTVESGTKVEHDYVVENKGGSDLIIDKVKVSCGCSSAQIKDKVIAPGGQGVVHVVFDTKDFEGRQEKAFTIYSNDPMRHSVLCFLNGIVKSSVYHIDPAAIRFEDAQTGKADLLPLKIERSDEEKFRILSIDSSLPFVAYSFEDMGKENISAYIDVVLMKDAPIGRHKGTLFVTTDVREMPKIDIKIIANVKGDIDVLPQSFDVGMITEKNKEWVLVLNPVEGRNIEIVDIFAQKGSVSIKKLPNDRIRAYTFVITPVAFGKGETVSDTIVIHTNSTVQPVIKVPFKGKF